MNSLFRNACAVAVMVCHGLLAWGQVPTGVDALIRQHERAVQDATRRESPGVDVLAPEQALPETSPPSAPVGNCRLIAHIRLEGHPDALGAPPQHILDAYLGRCLRAEEINALLGDLNRWYQQRGWTTTRAYAAEQDINGGELVLRIVAGRIEGYRYQDREADDKLLSAFPAAPGDYLNLRDLEQGLENLNRLPSQESKFTLHPGREPGDSVVVVEMADKPRRRITELVDNSGNGAMGVWRSNTELALDNLLERNDQLALGYNRNLDHGDLGATFEGFTANYLLSRGYHLWGTSLAAFDTRFTTPGINQNYAFETHSRKAGLSYEYLFARSQSSKHSLLLGLDFTQQNSSAAGYDVSSQYRRLSVAYLGVKGKHYFGNNIVDWQLRTDQGTGLFNAMDSISGGSNPRYQLRKAQLSLTVPLPQDAGIWRGSLQLQNGAANTPSLAQLYVGSRYNVRGFRDNSLFGATGQWLRNDLESQPIRLDGVALTPYAGLDLGYVKPNDQQPVSQHHLSGAALGVRLDWGQVKADIACTRALSRPDEFSAEPAVRWLAQFSITL